MKAEHAPVAASSEKQKPQWVWLIGLMVSPYLLLGSTSVQLYTRNQHDLAYQTGVLIPFGIAAVLVWGLAMLGFAHFRRALWSFAWAYLLMPLPIFLASLLPGHIKTFQLIAAGVLLGVGSALLRNRNPKRYAAAFALAAPVFLVSDAVVLIAAFEDRPVKGGLLALLDEREIGRSDSPQQPNIYHLIFDQYQAEAFELTQARSFAKGELNGFLHFSNTISAYQRTRMSLSSIFLGRHLKLREDQESFTTVPFQSEESFLTELKRVGYETYGFQLFRWRRSETLVDHRVQHSAHVAGEASNAELFGQIWLAATLPVSVARPLIGEKLHEQVFARDKLGNTPPLTSVRAFEHIIRAESELPAWNRYTYVHLTIPHRPFVLGEQCEVIDEEPQVSFDAFITQSQCANRLIGQFVAELRALGRFENSMIVIQSDHGSNARFHGDGGEMQRMPKTVSDLTPELVQPLASSLLLIKPPRASDQSPLRRIDADAVLIDVAPTILDAIGLPKSPGFLGRSLLSANLERERARSFFVYEKIGGMDRTNRLHEWIFTGNTIEKGEEFSVIHADEEGS